MPRPLPLLLLAALAACAPLGGPGDGDAVRLVAEPAAAAPGDTVRLTLENRSAEPVGYNLCASGLQRREGTAWSAVPSERVCTLELRILEPGASATEPIPLPTGLAPGEYRAVTVVERMDSGGRAELASEPFAVRG